MKTCIVLEAEAVVIKWLDGHRKDTMPIVNALKEKGFDAEAYLF